MGHLDISAVSYFLPDGRPLLDEVDLRLLRIVAGDEAPHGGSVARSGGLGVMRQMVGRIDDDRSIRDLLASLAPAAVRDAATELTAAELGIMAVDDEPAQMR